MMRAIAVAVAAIRAGTAHAHEYVAVPTSPRVAAGATLRIEGCSAPSLLNADEREPLEASRVRLVHAITRTELPLRADEARPLQVGSAPAPASAGRNRA
jgi:hypothetical protein